MNIKLVDYGLRISDIGIRPMENGFILHIDDEHKIEDYFNNPDILYNVYKENKDFFKNKRCTRESLFRHIKNGYIKPSFEFSNFVDYICNNEFFKDKKILLQEEYDIFDEKFILEQMKEYSRCVNNVYIRLKENKGGIVSIIDAYNTIIYIKNLVSKIRSYNFSPMEELMYAYDEVRKRVYKEEKKGEETFISRGLTYILNGDKIVCGGYSIWYDSILKYMGYNCIPVTIEADDESCHSRNSVYVKDDKYDIDGVYYFDTTWDSNDGVTNEYLNSYLYFAKTKKQIEKLSPDCKQDFEILANAYGTLKFYLNKYLKDKDIKTLETIRDYTFEYDFIKSMSSLVYKDISILSEIRRDLALYRRDSIDKELFKERIDSNLEYIKSLYIKYNSPISLDKMVKIFNNVRKVEYLQDNSYPYDIESVVETILRSQWIDVYSLDKEKIIKNSIKNNKIDKDIKQYKKIK